MTEYFKKYFRKVRHLPLTEMEYNNIKARVLTTIWSQLIFGVLIVGGINYFVITKSIDSAVKNEVKNKDVQHRLDSIIQKQEEKLTALDSIYNLKYLKQLDQHSSDIINNTNNTRLKYSNGLIDISNNSISFKTLQSEKVIPFKMEFGSFETGKRQYKIKFKKQYNEAPLIYFSGGSSNYVTIKAPVLKEYNSPVIVVKSLNTKYAEIIILGRRNNSLTDNYEEFQINWFVVGN